MHTPDEQAIAEHTRALLRRADAKGKFPTPVDDIVAAAGLVQPKESLFSSAIVNEAPAHLRRAIRRLTGPVRALLDRKEREVHIDPAIHVLGRVAWLKLHEATHEILPWQQALGYADDDATLAPSVRALFEREANLGASNLLFQHDAFEDVCRQYKTEMASVLSLAELVGASGHATFRRFVRVHSGVVAGVVMDLSPCTQDPLGYRRHEVETSEKWREQFGTSRWPTVLHAEPYSFIQVADAARLTGGAVRAEFMLPNVANDVVGLTVDVYSNKYNLFALIWKPRREVLRRRRIIVPETIRLGA